MNTQYLKMTIPDWNVSDRPREKYISKGAASLSDAELVAILLRVGSREESAVDLGRRLLKYCNNSLNELSMLSITDLMKMNGIGETKAITLLVAFELGKRCRSEKVEEKKKINFSADVVELMQNKIAHIMHEEFWVIFLNQASKILKIENMGKGGITSTIVDVRLIMKRAIELSATGIIICHNHPSGETKPSRADDILTKQIADAANILNVKLLDHIIVSKELSYSYYAEGKI